MLLLQNTLFRFNCFGWNPRARGNCKNPKDTGPAAMNPKGGIIFCLFKSTNMWNGRKTHITTWYTIGTPYKTIRILLGALVRSFCIILQSIYSNTIRNHTNPAWGDRATISHCFWIQLRPMYGHFFISLHGTFSRGEESPRPHAAGMSLWCVHGHLEWFEGPRGS